MSAVARTSVIARNIVFGTLALCLSATTAAAQLVHGPTGTMLDARYAHTATALADGTVLIAGGVDLNADYTNICRGAELYDPSTRLFSRIFGLTERAVHTATLLTDGKVLVVGGLDCANSRTLTSAELYDPSTRRFTPVGSLNKSRAAHTATRLPDGRVLVVGGLHRLDDGRDEGLASVEIYDPSTGTFTSGPALVMARGSHVAAPLANGKVLVAGGTLPATESSELQYLATAEVYDAATNTFTETGSMTSPRTNMTASRLPDGTVMIAGGWAGGDIFSTVDVFDAATGSFTAGPSMTTGRVYHDAMVLENGSVLITGGVGGSQFEYLQSAELYEPVPRQFVRLEDMRSRRTYHAAARLTSNMILLAGGIDGIGPVTASAEIFEVVGPPIANAGPDQTVGTAGLVPATVTLSGTVSSGRAPFAYEWSGPSGIVATTATTTVSLTAGTYQYRLTVTDARGLRSTDSVNITVVIDVSDPPVANAGADQNLVTGVLQPMLVTLNGTATGGYAPLAYQWSGATGVIGTTPSVTVSLPIGQHEFRLMVTDARGLQSSDTVVVTVTLDTSDPPVANAGPDQTVYTNSFGQAVISLTGLASGGFAPLVYEWSGPNGVLTTTTNASVTLTPGLYEFRFKVTDRRQLTSIDTVAIAVHLPTSGGGSGVPGPPGPGLSFAMVQVTGESTIVLPTGNASTIVLAAAAAGQRATAATTVTLPAASEATSRFVVVRRMDSERGRLVVRPPSGPIAGGSQADAVVLERQFDQVVLVSDGTTWIVFSR